MITRLAASVLRLALALAALAVIMGALLFETGPRVRDANVADAAAAARAFDLVEEARAVAARGGAWRLGEAEINAALAAAGRVQRGFRGAAEVRQDGVHLDLAHPVPGLPLWLNVSGRAASGREGLVLEEVRIGHLPLPPALAEAALRIGLDLALGPGSGPIMLAALARLETEPPHLVLEIALAEADRALIVERLRAAMAARSGTGFARDRVLVHLAHLHDGGAAGGTSMLPFLVRALEAAASEAEGRGAAAAGEEMRAALFALALYCGDERFGTVIGVSLPRAHAGRRGHCHGLTLAGRQDLRKHFAVSAGLYAATSWPAAKGVGELKELLDSSPGGTGFSFDDIAANIAGARFAEEALARPPADWPSLAARIDGEAAVMPAIADLPAGLDEAAFRARYGDVESSDYRRKLDLIRARIEALPLYRPVIN